MDNFVMERTEADTNVFGSTHNQPMYQELHDGAKSKGEQFTLDAFFTQEGILPEECTSVESSECRQTCAPPSSIYAEPSMKEVACTIGAGLMIPSRVHGTEGAAKDLSAHFGLHGDEGGAKDLSAFFGSSYSTVFSGSLGSIYNEMRTPELTAWNTQKLVIHQKPQKSHVKGTDLPKETTSQAPIRVARPPGEGRGKNQLLPRYWPRVTDQELQFLRMKDSNSTITPLFEKVLSASDAGKIGRLVLPKACAEAYFPLISQPEGVPLIVQDVSGKEWVFQFRFWPNNNSRMYVLEGITPCIQSMNLQAGDTVIFSRLDPEGKLAMGYRRAPNLLSAEENKKSITMTPISATPLRPTSLGSMDKGSTITSLTKLLMQTEENSSKAQCNRKLGQFNVRVADNGYRLYKMENLGSKAKSEVSRSDLLVTTEKRKAHEPSIRNKRHQADAEKVEFRKNWEDAQKLLRSPPNVAPTIITIEGYDFEEYEEPPVFGKGISSTTCSVRNAYTSQQDLDKDKASSLLQQTKGMEKVDKTETMTELLKAPQPCFGLETLANLATIEGNNKDHAAPSAATTTKHPRHRPGCSCIVCIQPPSGKGPKHKPNCDCNVCLTVKRRFHTLMLRRKKLQSEREAEIAAQRNQSLVTSGEANIGERGTIERELHCNGSWHGCTSTPSNINGGFYSGSKLPLGISSMGCYAPRGLNSENVTNKFDLNSQPERDEELNRAALPLSMKRLLQSAGYPLDTYLKEQGLTSLTCQEQTEFSVDSPVMNDVTKEEEHDQELSPLTLLKSNEPDVQPNFDHTTG